MWITKSMITTCCIEVGFFVQLKFFPLILNTWEKCIFFACDAITVILEFLLMNWDVDLICVEVLWMIR